MVCRSASSAMLALALLCAAGGAAAVNPLGLAVAGAPSMFVLAVAQASGDTRGGRVAQAGPHPEARAADTDRLRQAAAPSPPGQRTEERTEERSEERKLADSRQVAPR